MTKFVITAFYGQGSGGKSSLIKRLQNKGFDKELSATIGIQPQFYKLNVDGEEYSVTAYELGGQAQFGKIIDTAKNLVKNPQIPTINNYIIDLANPQIKYAEELYKGVKKFGNTTASHNVVLTKKDLVDDTSELESLVEEIFRQKKDVQIITTSSLKNDLSQLTDAFQEYLKKFDK